MKLRLELITALFLIILLSSNTAFTYIVEWEDVSYTWNTWGGSGGVNVSPDSEAISSEVQLVGWFSTEFSGTSESTFTILTYSGRFRFKSEYSNTDPIDLTLSATSFGSANGTSYNDLSIGGGFNWDCSIAHSSVADMNGSGNMYIWDYPNFSIDFSDSYEYDVTLIPGYGYTFSANLTIWANMPNMGSGEASNGSSLDPTGLSFVFNLPTEIPAVPIPSAVWLLGSGLIGIMGIRRKFNK
jgi:hypothetical protein